MQERVPHPYSSVYVHGGVGAQKLHSWGQLCATTPSSSEFVEM